MFSSSESERQWLSALCTEIEDVADEYTPWLYDQKKKNWSLPIMVKDES